MIKNIDFEKGIPELLGSKSIFYCSAGINTEIFEILNLLSSQGAEIFIVIDLDSNNDYLGLNEIEKLNELFERPNVKIKNSKGINISCISNLNEYNYIIFPISKILKEKSTGYNAIEFDGLTATKLFAMFFPELVQLNSNAFLKIVKLQNKKVLDKLNDELEDITNDEFDLNELLNNVECFNVSKVEIEKNRIKIKEFPPEKPDLKRKVDFICTHIQVVDFKFEGANWQSTRVTIPQKLIPFKNETLKKNLDSKLKIFTQDEEDDSLKKFNALKKEVEDLRKEYFFRSKLRSKSIIKLNEKKEFISKYNELMGRVNSFKESLFELIKSQIAISKEKIKNELVEFYTINPDEKMSKFKNYANYHSLIIDEVDELIKKIKFPTVYDIIGDLEVTVSFLNFTYEDFEDLKFLEELSNWEKLSNEEYFMLFEKQKGFSVK